MLVSILVTSVCTTGCYIEGSMFPVRDSVESANKLPVVIPNVQLKKVNS